MKKWYFLILYFEFAFSTVFLVSAQEPPEAITWEGLKKSSSTSVVAAAGNCQKWINEAKSNCKASIDHATQLLAQKKDNAAVQTLIVQETIEEVSSILQSVSSNVYGQLSEVASRYQKRLEQVINSSNSVKPEILNELKGILQSPADQSDQMLANIQQLFSSTYNPSTKLKEKSANELGKLASVSNLEIDQIQKVILATLSQLNKGTAIAKDVQAVLKKSGQLPQNWASDNLQSILLSSIQITSTLQLVGKTLNQSNPQTVSKEEIPQEQKNKVMSMRQTLNDELSLMEEEIDLDDEDNESGCGQIFERSKKRIRTKLVETVKDIKKATDAKSIDTCTSTVLENYEELLGDVCHKINGKIVDFAHQFIKLYKSVSDIMETINKDMNEKMVEIFQDQGTDVTDFYYNNIRKYFADTYLTDAKMHDLYNMVANCMKTSKTRKSLQKQIIKQLSTVTSDLVRDMDTMKSTTVYILLEIRKGVSALQNLKNKSNVSGIRYWFNFYDGKTDLAQVKKIIYIINAININGIFEREITTLQSSINLTKCENLTKMIQDTLSKRTSDLLLELDQKSNLNEIETVRSNFLQTFNSITTVYKLKVKKIMKQTVVTFINVYEETLITLKRKNVKDVQYLDAILDNETRNIDSDIPIFAIYLAKNNEMSIEQDTGINVRRKFKNLGEAKYTLKSNINEINQILSSHMMEMNTGIQEIMKTITEESQNLQQLQKEVESNPKYTIDVNKFIKLESLMKLANTLKISHGDITNGLSTDMNSSNQQLESYLDNAIERLRSEKQNAILEIEKCSNAKQLQIQVTTVTTRLTEIISDTVMEMRSDINRYTTQYKAALNTYIKCTNHETLFKVLERGRNNNKIKIMLSAHLQNYLKDQYSQVVLQSFRSSADKNKNIQKSKAFLIESLSTIVKQIENDIGSAKSEAMNTIFSTFKQAIDVLEMANSSETKQRLDEEKIQTLVSLSRLLKILQENTAIDAEGSIGQARNAISTARDAINNEYTRIVKTLSSTTNTNAIQAEIKNAVDLFESIYNTMRQQIKSKMETLSIDHYERFKIVNPQTSKTKKMVQEIMGGIYNKEFIEKEEYKKFSSFINSESYTSNLAINSIYEKLSSGQSNKITNGQSLNIINNLNTEIDQNISNMEEMVNYVANIYGESTNIIISINKGKELEITDVNDISILSQSLLIYQTLLQVQNRADFVGVQKTIHQEYREAVQTIMSAQDENIVQETIVRSIEKYDTITNILENEVTQKFMKITADFTNKYETVMQVVIAEKNEELLAILQNIVEKKVCDIVSEKYKKFESYINSCTFRSTTFAKDSYQTIVGQEDSSATRDTRLEQLKMLTDKIEEYIQELDIESQFANENILKGASILHSIQSGNFELTKEQIQIITECVMISQIIFKQNFSSIQLRNDDEWEAVSSAKRSVEEEYNYVIETLKTMKEKVVIEQTIATSIYKYNDIYNNLREEMKQTFSTLQMEFISTYDTITEILQIQNIPMYDRLQKIQNNPTNISIKYTKFESYIESETFTSYSLIRYELLKLQQAKTVNKVDTYVEQMSTLTKITNKQIEEISIIQKYVTEVLQRSVEILQNTESDINIQLNEEQFTTLCEAFKISKIVEAVISSKEQIDEKFLLAERSINDICENAINEMQTNTFDESILSNSIQNFTTIYTNLRVNVQEMFTHKSTFFVSTFTTVSKSISLQNSELSSTFDSIEKQKIDTQQFSKEYQAFVTYINSEKFSSSSYISYMYQNIRMQEVSSTTNIKERSVQQLTKLTNDVKQMITNLHQIHQQVLNSFNENMECLKAIENGSSSKISEEQIIRLKECVNISEIVTFTCVTVSEEREIIFQTAETTINREFEKAISSLIEVKETSEIMQIMDTSLQYYEETYNILKKEVRETLIQTSTEFTKYYTKLLENVKSKEYTELQTFLEEVQNTRSITSCIESYKKSEIYLNSESFKSCSWVLQHSAKDLQQMEAVTKESSINKLQTITSEVNHQITQARYASKYIVQVFQQSTEILKLLENSSADQQLTQEQKQKLIESMIILDQISCKFSAKSQQEETLYTTTQTTIRSTYSTAITTLKNTKEVEVIRQTLSDSAKSYNDFYNSYRKEVKTIFTQTITEYSETFETIIKQVTNGNNNAQLQTTLNNIRNKKINIQVTEKYTKFESYIYTEKFVSRNVIKRFYNKMNTQIESSDQVNNQSINQLQSLTDETEILVSELNDIRQYISETIQMSSTILKSIENNSNIKITQEQITILMESILISELISVETSSVSQKEEQIFTTAENSIEEKQNYAINTIRSSDKIEEVEEVITTTVKNYDEIYNTAKEEVKNSFTTSTTEFNQMYTKITEIFETQGKTEIKNLLASVQKKKVNIETSQRYKNFEAYLCSEAFTTSLFATHSYQNITNHSTTKHSGEECIRNIERISIEIESQLTEMNAIQKYISQTLQRSTRILKKLESDVSITEITQEEITILTESIMISETMYIEFNSTVTKKEEIFTMAEMKIEQEHENALNKIKTATDEETIKQTLQESIETYDTTVKSVQEEVENTFTETTTQFMSVFNEILDTTTSHTSEAVKTVLQDIKNHQVEVEVSEEYTVFEEFISSETFSTFSITESYSEIQKEEVTNSETTINDKCVNQLEKLTTQVNKYITKTHIVRKYITRVFEKSTKILKVVEQEENIELTKEQTNILSESIMISEKLSSQSNTVVNTEKIITKECENAVQSIQTMNTKEEVEEVVKKNVQTYSKAYKKVEEKMETTLTQTSTEFTKSFDTLLLTSGDTNSQILKEIENSKNEVKHDQQLSQFKSYMENKHASSTNSINEIYTNVCESNKNENDFKMQGIKELKDLSQEVNNKLIEMNEYQKYATENIAKGQAILQSISNTNNVSLDREQIITITKTVEIIETISRTISIKQENNTIEESKFENTSESKSSKQEKNENTFKDTIKEQKVEKTQARDLIINGGKENVQEDSSINNENKKTNEDQETTQEVIKKQSVDKNTCDIKMVQNVVKEEHESTINLIKVTENEEKVEEVVQEHKKILDKTYNEAQQNTKSQIVQTSSDYLSHLQETMNEVENTQVSQTLNKVINEDSSDVIEEDKELENFINCVKNKNFLTDTIEENINQETLSTTDIKEKSIKTVDSMDKKVSDNLKIMEETSKFVSENLQKSDSILEKVRIGKEVELNEEEIKQIARSAKITKVLQESETLNLNTTTSNKSLDTRDSLTTTDIKEHNVDKSLKIEEKKTTEESVLIENQNFATYQSSIGGETGSESEETKMGEQETIIEGKHESIEKVNTNSQNNELNTGKEKKIETDHVQEKNVKMSTSSEKETQTLKKNEEIKMEEVTTFANGVSKKTQHSMEKETQSENQELKTEQTTKVNEKAMENEYENNQLSLNTETQNTQSEKLEERQGTETINNRTDKTTESKKEQVKSADKLEAQSSNGEKQNQSTSENEDHSVDFATIQHTIEEENSAIINSIKQTENEEQVEEMVKERVQVLDKTYENARHNAEEEITQTSEKFVNTFQSTLSQVQNTETQNTLNGIMNENLDDLVQEDEELQRFESCMKSETFSSTFTVTNEFHSIQESETSTDVKEKSVHEIETLGTKVNENLRTMEETTKFVSENLQKSADILKKVETDTEVELNEEEVHQIAKSMKITKVLYESETLNSDSQTTSTRSINTSPNNVDENLTQNSQTESTHESTKIEKETREQSTQTTTKMESTSTFNALTKDNCLSVEPQKCHENKSRTLEKVSTSDLLVNWEVVKPEDKCWPTECRSLSWNSNKFSDSAENKIFVEEISQILTISRNLIENTINIELKKLKLNRKVREDLSAMTVCVDNIYNILQRLSTYIFEEMERFEGTVGSQIKTKNIGEKLKTVSATLDGEFLALGKTFFDLQYSKSIDMLDLIDQQYENEICDTISKSRKVAMKKLEKLQSTINTILDNIDCLVLTMLDTFVSAELTIQNLAKGSKTISLESLKNYQKLYEVLEV